MMEINLADKVIVVTGSSRGIGKKIIIAFAKEGAKVVINYKSNSEAAYSLYEDLKVFNKNCIVVQADVTIQEDVQKLYYRTLQELGTVDILINNAGICDDNYIQFMSIGQWMNVLNSNLTSAFLCGRIFSKQMIRAGRGKIFNIASIKGQLGSEGQGNYAASKAGMVALTKSMAKEMGKSGVCVNALCPGFIVTDLNRGNNYKVKRAEEMSVFDYRYGLSDLIKVLMLLCSDHIQGISGQVFNLDSRID